MLDAPYTIVHAIQLAVAPVFLLTGIAAMLSILNARLSRIVDRLRFLESVQEAPRIRPTDAELELARLSRRARLVHRAVALCTGSALCISAVIAVIFVSFFFSLRVPAVIASLFVAATVTFMLGLLHFLGEMQLATRIFRNVRLPHADIGTEVEDAE